MPYKDPHDPRRLVNRRRVTFIRRAKLKQDGLCRECRRPAMGKTLCRECYDDLYVKRGDGLLNRLNAGKAEQADSWNGGYDRRQNGKFNSALRWALIMHREARQDEAA